MSTGDGKPSSAQVEGMPLDGGTTVGEAGKRDPRIADAVARGVSRARVYKSDYHADGTVTVYVSLELRANELNLLMGPSGSGKTTLLALVSALLRPCGGRVQALDQDVWNMSEQDLVRALWGGDRALPRP